MVTGCNPLRAFIHEDGLARFATEVYEKPDRSNVGDRHMHLTNVAVNKKAWSYGYESKRALSWVY